MLGKKSQEDRVVLEQAPLQAAEDAKASKQKVKTLQRLSTLLLVLGILGLLLPFLNSYLLARNSKIDMASLTHESMAQAQANITATPFDEIKEIGYVDFWPLLGKWQASDIMAELHIPDLDINLAVFNSASNTNLLAGVGALMPDRGLGADNLVLTGHHVQGKGVLLHNLMDAEEGQKIYLTDKKDLYVYKIIYTAQKDTDAVYMLDASQNLTFHADKILTIMTCYQGKVSSRWFVVAELEEVSPYQADFFTKESSK